MTTFLWTAVILMAAALLLEIFAFVGMAMVAARTARRAVQLVEQFNQALEPSIRIAKELQQSLQPRLETIKRENQAITTIVSTRAQSIQAALQDTSRRSERLRLRLLEGVETVEGEQRARRGIYRDVVEPIQTAGQVMRGLKIALWILRRVA